MKDIDAADVKGVNKVLIYGSAGKKVKAKLKDVDLIQQFQGIEAIDEKNREVMNKIIDAFTLSQR